MFSGLRAAARLAVAFLAVFAFAGQPARRSR